MQLNKKSLYPIIFCSLFLVYILAYQENIYVPIHDNLEDICARYSLLQNYNLFWTVNTKAPILGGLDRNLLPSDLKVQSWVYMLFPAFQAYVILLFMKIFLAIAGGIYLGKTLLRDKYDVHAGTIIFCSFLYGILPNEPVFPFCFAGLPLLLAILIQLYREPKWYHYCAVFGTAFLSDLTYFGMFECGYILIFFLINWVISKQPKWRMLGALLALAIGLILVEWRLFYAVFLGEPLIRTKFVTTYSTLGQSIKQSIIAFVFGHYHSADSHFFIVLPTCFAYFICSSVCAVKENGLLLGIKKCLKNPFNWLMLWALFNAFCSGFDHWPPIETLKSMIPGLKGFQIARTLWFNGFIWYFAFCLILIKLKNRRMKIMLCSLAFLVVCFVPQMYNHIYINTKMFVVNSLGEKGLETVKNALKKGIIAVVGSDRFERKIGSERFERSFHYRTTSTLSYNEFYSPELFEKIKKEIHYNGEWSVAFGMHPAVLYYNKIATLDAYHPYYTQAYKEQFRKLIAPDLEVDESNQKYYDDWGGRAYVFSNECSYDPIRNLNTQSANLLIDSEVFKEMGGKYVFSRVEVKNYANLGLKHTGTFTEQHSPYKIYVYKLERDI